MTNEDKIDDLKQAADLAMDIGNDADKLVKRLQPIGVNITNEWLSITNTLATIVKKILEEAEKL